MTHPCAPRDNLELYRQLGDAFDRRSEAEALCAAFEAVYARVLPGERQDVLYLIWRDPWMSVGPDTYISRTLAAFNWHTRPASPRDRYPQVELETFAGRVDRVLLSSEPFHFKARHVAEVRSIVSGAEVSLIDGEMTSWYGSRAIAGLEYFAGYVACRGAAS